MKKLKSMIFLLLTLVLIFCMMPTPTAFAAEMTGEATEEDIFQTAEVENSVDMSAISTYATRAEGKYGQRAVVWTCNGESLEYTYNGNSHDSAYLIMHEIWHNSEWHIAYCIQPGVNIVSTSVYDDEGFNGDALWGYLDADVQRAVSLALLYGYPNSLDSTDLSATVAYQVATYMVIQELIIGWRETTYPYAQLEDTFYDVFGGGTAAKPEKLEITSDFYPELEGTYLDREDIAYAYNFLSEKLRKHDLIPSFASSFRNQAPTYTMTANGDGTYSVTLTDTNGILSEYSFTNTDDLTFTKSSNGKSVTITTSNPNLGTVTVAPTKTVPSAEDSAYLIWTADTGSQALVTIKTAEEDPVPAYFKLTIPTGTCKIVKESTNGGTVSGWKFTIKDSDGNTVGTYTTDSTGVITVDLDPGTYTVTETAKSSSYWHCDTDPQTVTVTAGKTATVTFTNEYIGKCKIVKTTTNGGTVSGWKFTIKDSNRNTVGAYTTDSTGVITVDLDPGTYTVTETAKSSSYWHCDTDPQTVTITAGKTATVTFTNEYIGKCKIVKTTTNGGTVSGWKFTIKDSNGNTVGTYTTDSTGVITVNLDPGTYTVTETAKSSSYWHCDTDPQTVTVTAGKTATVTFTNEYIGKCKIVKTTTNGGTVSGWKFTIKDSNGNTVGTYTTDSTGVITVDLDPGTYTVTETAKSSSYWHCDTDPQTVTITAGKTATVTFTNEYIGKCKIVKTTTNGGTVSGWKFTIKDSNGNTVGTYTTGSTGIITVDLDPGIYTVQEIDSGDPYWICDTTPQTITVVAGRTSSVTFKNQWLGKVNIIKKLSNPEAGTVEGWKFSIHKVSDNDGAILTEFVADATTNADGTILYDLDPGDYLITEILEEGTLWQCTSENPQRVTVKAGETAEVTFTNALRPGQLSILKTDIYGEPLAGATFILEWSKDGVNWSPVMRSDSEVVVKGCSSDAASQTSPASGLIGWHNLYPTLYYRITEVEAPEGYSLLETAAFEGQLPIDDLTVTLQVVNSRTFMLPATGSYDSILLSLGVALCLAVCAGALFTLRRKEE